MSRVKMISIPPVALSRSVGSGGRGGGRVCGRWVVVGAFEQDGWGTRRGRAVQIERRCVEPSS